MRIALVTPYSWTYQGGVNRHVQSLAEEYISRGHYVRVIAPFDPPDRLSKVLHRAPAEDREIPDYLIPVGRTFGVNANGAVSNIPVFPSGVTQTRRAIEEGNFDVVHLHEPTTPANGWDTCLSSDVPVVGTFHAYSTKPVPNYLANAVGARRTLNRLSARIAVSQAAAWTGRRWYGGNYTIVPNGVDVDAAPDGPKPETDHLRALFVGRPDERKGLPVLLRAFSALVDHVPARLSVVGAGPEDVQRILAHPELADHLDLHGRVSNEELWQQLHDADVLVAPSLSGESFGMILTEAFAVGTPVIASGIAGYSDVVTHNHDGILVPPADPQALAEELQWAHHEPERLAEMGEAARESAQRYAWSNVADQVMDVYERAIEVPEPEDTVDRVRRRIGIAPSDGLPWAPAVKLPSLDPVPASGPSGGGKSWLRKAGLAAMALFGLGLTAIAAQKIGVDQVADKLVDSDISWVLIALALMASSLFFRAWSWFFIARSAMPHSGLKRRDFASATMIGVLMSATLPARLGEPARAISLARHTGRAKDTLPVVIGTIVSQTMLNILAILLLGAFVLTSMDDVFHGATKQILLYSMIPAALLLAVIAAPTLLGAQNGKGRLARIGSAIHSVTLQVRRGLTVFRHPRNGGPAVALQLFAWVIQMLSCWALMFALGLESQAGLAAAAAVLLAVNVTAIVPATPSNIGVFQLAVIFVLHKGWGVSTADALAYGVILQAVEMATAAALGVPALVREGLTWSDLRTQAIASAPVELDPYSKNARRQEKRRQITYTR